MKTFSRMATGVVLVVPVMISWGLGFVLGFLKEVLWTLVFEFKEGYDTGKSILD